MRADLRRLAHRALAALACGLAGAAGAQTYLNTPEPFDWEPTAGHTPVVWTGAPGDPAPECQGGSAAVDDDITQELPLGFTFRFGASTYSTARVMSNGRLQFANRYCGNGSANSGTPRSYPLPMPNGNLSRVMRVYGNDLDPSAGGTVTYATVGAAPSRSFVVTWTNVPEWNAAGSFFNLQIVVRERGDFVYRYGASSNPSLGKAQIGWQLSTSDYALLSFGSIGELAASAVRWTPRPNNFLVEAAAGGAIGTQLASAPFGVRITARDAAGSTLASFNGTVTVTSTGVLSQGGGVSASFIDGVLATHTVAISNTGTFTITASGAGAGGTSNAFDVVPLSAFLIAEYRMDEPGWSGAANEVADSSVNGYHGRAVNALTSSATPAISGSPGTCGYGVFNRNNAFVELPATFPNLQGSFTIAGWIRPTVDVNGDQRIFADDQGNSGGIGFSLGDGGAGRLRFFSRSVAPVSLDSTAVIGVGQWHFVAAVHDAPAKRMSLFAFDAAGVLQGTWSQTYTGNFGLDNGRASIGGENAAAGSEAVPRWRFGGNIDELKFYSLPLAQAQLDSIVGTSRVCPGLVPAPGGFNAFEVTTPPGSTNGVIRTKVAGAPFSLALVALNADGSSVLTGFIGAVTVELLDASNPTGALIGATGCRSSWTPIQTLPGAPSFGLADQGRINIALSEPGAWREVRVRISHGSGPTAVVACSSDGFAIRPAAFAGVQASDSSDSLPGTTRVLDNTAPTSGTVHRAGRPFSVLAQAMSATGAVTAGYTASAPGLTVTGCIQPAGCTAGAISSALAANLGVVVGTATYAEAGVITARLEDLAFAAVDAGDSTLEERAIRSDPITIGRFIADRYDLALANTPVLAAGACGAGGSQTFTFVGQPFGFATAPRVAVTPLNADGQPLANARPRFGTEHVAAALTATSAPVPVTGTPQVAGIAHSHASQVTFDTSSFHFPRAAAAVASFAPQLAFDVAVSDSTEPGATGPVAGSLTPAYGPLAFTGGSGQFHDGRIAMRPTYGDVRRDQWLMLEVQAFNGTGWVTLPEMGNCLVAAAGAFAYDGATGALSASGTTPNCASRVMSAVSTNHGRVAVWLPRPGPTSALQPAAMTVTLNVLEPASGQTCSGTSLVAASTTALPWLASRLGGAFANPAARVTWGRLRNDFISVRERFD
jgi:MSHA biogenesis protein MshQ